MNAKAAVHYSSRYKATVVCSVPTRQSPARLSSRHELKARMEGVVAKVNLAEQSNCICLTLHVISITVLLPIFAFIVLVSVVILWITHKKHLRGLLGTTCPLMVLASLNLPGGETISWIETVSIMASAK